MAEDATGFASHGFIPSPGSPPGGPLTLNFTGNLPAQCDADFNHSGVVSVQDIYDFLSAWQNGCP